MAIITYWRNVMRKITTQEMDASFDAVVDMIANAGLSSEMPEGTIYIGDNTNTASLETLNTSIVPSVLDKRYVTDANLTVIGNTSGTNTGDNATNTTSNAYADGKVADAINDGVTTIAPSQNAVFDALALKSPLASPTFIGTVTTPDIVVSDATASTIAHFDGTKNIESLPTATYPNLTELSYAKGVTSAIQTQINTKVGGSGTTDFIPKFTASGTIGNSTIRQNYYDHATFIKGSLSYAYALSVFNDNESVGLLIVQNNGALTLLNSTKHQFGSNGVGQIIFDRNLTNNNLSFFRATDTSSANYIQGWINSTESIYGLRYSNDLVAYWQSVNTTASTKISRWADSANTQVALLQNDGLYLGTGTKSTSAILQADSTTKGFLPPRMTSAQKELIANVEGLVVFDTDIDSLCQNNGTTWITLGIGAGNTTSSATPTIDTDTINYYELTAQAVDITSFSTNLTGTPKRGQKLLIDITGTGARAITWGASFEASTIALPTTTVSTNKLSVGFIWNVATSKWRCIGTC